MFTFQSTQITSETFKVLSRFVIYISLYKEYYFNNKKLCINQIDCLLFSFPPKFHLLCFPFLVWAAEIYYAYSKLFDGHPQKIDNFSFLFFSRT